MSLSTVPGIVLDPFIGSGTTAMVADYHGRDCVGIDLSEDYLDIARQRIAVGATKLKKRDYVRRERV